MRCDVENIDYASFETTFCLELSNYVSCQYLRS